MKNVYKVLNTTIPPKYIQYSRFDRNFISVAGRSYHLLVYVEELLAFYVYC